MYGGTRRLSIDLASGRAKNLKSDKADILLPPSSHSFHTLPKDSTWNPWLGGMNLDEEEPPSLVDVNGIEEENAIPESRPIKVPITIVTGK